MIAGALNVNKQKERHMGIMAGFAMADLILDSHHEECVFFGVDYGDSDGMRDYARPHHEARGRVIVDLRVGKL